MDEPEGTFKGFTKGMRDGTSQDVVEDVRKRLRRVAGQVQGVERMLEEAESVATSSLNCPLPPRPWSKLGSNWSHPVWCTAFRTEQAEADGYAIEEVQRML